MDSAPFEFRILGPTELRGSRPDVDDANVRPPKRLALFAYLALETAQGFKRRDQIVGLFWPDLPQDAARTQLRKAIFAFRESLGSDAVTTRGEGEIRLDPAYVWCDAVALQQYVREQRWSDALALYRGELLEGLYPEGVAQEFEEWLSARRKSLRELAAVATWECSRMEESRGDRKAAAVMARRALDLTPDDEAGIRRLMELLDRHGDRGGALRVYSEWQARMQKEYGVEPAPETRKVARRIQAARKGESHETPPTTQLPAYIPAITAYASSNAAAHVPQSMPKSGTIPVTAMARHRRRWIFSFFIVPVLLLVAWAATRSAPQALPNSVAVLPLRVIGDTTLFAATNGLVEELTNSLITVGGLTVRSTAHARDAVASGGDIDRLGRKLRVAYVIDGAVQPGAGSMRLTLRVIRAQDGMAVWAGTFDFDKGTAVVTAHRIAGEIRAVLSDTTRTP